MNCYDCEYFIIRYNKVLTEEPYCEKYHKAIPINHLAYNFFCWDGDMKPKEVNNDEGKHTQIYEEKPGRVLYIQTNIYGNRSVKNISPKSTKNIRKRYDGSYDTIEKGRKSCQKLLQDY